MSRKLSDIRKEHQRSQLDEKDVLKDPFEQFQKWMDDALDSDILEPTAMVLTTVGKNMQPSSRMVLLKDIKPNGFLFYSNYESKKGHQIEENHNANLLFWWPELERQIRIEGYLEKASKEVSDEYYLSRPGKSRIGAWASPQSQEIPDREWLEQKHADFELEFIGQTPTRPPHWGGYILTPYTIEFWQGRKNRLHDRIEYFLDGTDWKIRRLAP